MKTKLSVFLFFAASAVAQTTTTTTTTSHGPNVANMVARLTTLLSLTTAQQTQATAIFTNEQTAIAPVQAQMKSARTSLATAVKANDTATIDSVTAQTGTFEGQILDIQSKAQAAFYALLTADQQTKYTSLHGMADLRARVGRRPSEARGIFGKRKFYNLLTTHLGGKRVNRTMKTLLPALLLVSTAMFAQPPARGPHGDPMTTHIATMTTLLSLSSGQAAQATSIYSAAHTAEKGIQTSMHTAQTALAAAIKANDTASIDTLTAQIGSYHAQSLSIQSKAEASFYANLSAEQKTKYDTLHTHGFGGPGGPGGPRGDFRPARN